MIMTVKEDQKDKHNEYRHSLYSLLIKKQISKAERLKNNERREIK